jgi:hypothetical protein
MVEFYGNDFSVTEQGALLEYLINSRSNRLSAHETLEVALALTELIPESRSAFYLGNALASACVDVDFANFKEGLSVLSDIAEYEYFINIVKSIKEELEGQSELVHRIPTNQDYVNLMDRKLKLVSGTLDFWEDRDRHE